MIVEIPIALFDDCSLPPRERDTLMSGFELHAADAALRLDWDASGLLLAVRCPTFYRCAYELGEVPRVQAREVDVRTYLGAIWQPGLFLAGADFTGANARGLDWSGAVCAGAKLQRTDLRGARLVGADLIGAALRDANLAGADLADADLTGADLTGADLTGANFTRARLVGANLPLKLSNETGVAWADASLLGAISVWAPPGWRVQDGELVALRLPAQASSLDAPRTTIELCENARGREWWVHVEGTAVVRLGQLSPLAVPSEVRAVALETLAEMMDGAQVFGRVERSTVRAEVAR